MHRYLTLINGSLVELPFAIVPLVDPVSAMPEVVDGLIGNADQLAIIDQQAVERV